MIAAWRLLDPLGFDRSIARGAVRADGPASVTLAGQQWPTGLHRLLSGAREVHRGHHTRGDRAFRKVEWNSTSLADSGNRDGITEHVSQRTVLPVE